MAEWRGVCWFKTKTGVVKVGARENQGRIHGKTVVDGWVGAVMKKKKGQTRYGQGIDGQAVDGQAIDGQAIDGQARGLMREMGQKDR